MLLSWRHLATSSSLLTKRSTIEHHNPLLKGSDLDIQIEMINMQTSLH